MMSDPKSRAEEGMKGAEALTSLHTQGQSVDLAALDESNAFSFVATPAWMWPWFSAPPVKSCEVWTILPDELKARCNFYDWEAPQYQRLPMGFTHSVHILMNINLRHIGIVLLSSSKLHVNTPLRDSVEVVQTLVSEGSHIEHLDGLEDLSDAQLASLALQARASWV